jgi:hypothetical protein
MTTRMIIMAYVFGLVRALESPVGDVVEQTDEERLLEILEAMRHQDHFAQLGSHWSNHINEARNGFHELEDLYGPGAEYQAQSGTVSELAKEIWDLGRKAWDTISSAISRQQYRAQIVEIHQIRFSAELLYNQGKSAEYQANWEYSKRMYQASVDLLPSEQYKAALNELPTRQATHENALLERENK